MHGGGLWDWTHDREELMWVVCSNGKPISIKHLKKLVGTDDELIGDRKDEGFIAAPSKEKAIAIYNVVMWLQRSGWDDRESAIECERFEI